MNKKQFEQTVFNLGELPPIIAKKRTFGRMTTAERREFYKLANKTFKENGAPTLSGEYIKACLLYPENRINSILSSKCTKLSMKEKKQKWLLYVKIFKFCLEIFQPIMLPRWEKEIDTVKPRLSRAERRRNEILEDINEFTPKTISYAQN